jgi:hypothetical protein
MKTYIKLQVIVAFGFRLPVIGFAAAHLHYVSAYVGSSDVSKAIIPALLYQQFELFWSLLAATIPTLKAFMRSFNSGFGMEIDLDGFGSSYGYGSRGYHNGSIPLNSMQNASAVRGTVTTGTGSKAFKSQNRSRNNEDGDSDVVEILRTKSAKDKVRATASVTSDGSQELIIQREVQWSVYSEEAKN